MITAVLDASPWALPATVALLGGTALGWWLRGTVGPVAAAEPAEQLAEVAG